MDTIYWHMRGANLHSGENLHLGANWHPGANCANEHGFSKNKGIFSYQNYSISLERFSFLHLLP